MKLSGIAVRNIKRNKKRSILSVTATAIATLVIVFMFSIVGGLRLDMENIAYNYKTGQVLIRNRGFDEKAFSLNDAIDGYQSVVSVIVKEYPWVQISPRIKFPSTILDGDKSFQAYGVGVDFTQESSFLNLPDKIVEGSMPNSSREVIVGSGLAKELSLEVGDKFTPITLTRKGASSGITFKVSALAKFEDQGFTNKTFIASLEELPKMLRMEGAVSEILIKGLNTNDLDKAVASFNKTLSDAGFNSIEALNWKNVGAGYGILKMTENLYNFIALIFFALASTVIANTMLMVVFERRREIGTITSLGMTEREVVRLFFLEAFYLGVIGAFIGVVVGALLVVPLNSIGLDLTQSTGGVEMGSSFFIYPQLNFKSTVFVFIYSVFVASFISFFPSRGAAKVDPIVALRSE